MKTSDAAVKALIVRSPSDGRAVDDHEVHRIVGEVVHERAPQPVFAGHLCDELDLRPCEVDRAGRAEEVGIFGTGLDNVGEGNSSMSTS